MSNDERPALIGLAGGPGAGKDTAAGLLARRYGFRTIAFADALRDYLYATDDGWRMALDTVGYELAKTRVIGFRGRMIDTGEAVRRHIHPYVWVDAAMYRAEKEMADGHNVVISDVRYPNEAEAIRELDGTILGIDRDGREPETPEAFEVFQTADFQLTNNNDFGWLKSQLDDLVEWIL